MFEKMNDAQIALQVQTAMRFIGSACLAKSMMGGEEMLGNSFLESFRIYEKIGYPIIQKLTGEKTLAERFSSAEGFRDYVLEVAREVVKLLEHA